MRVFCTYPKSYSGIIQQIRLSSTLLVMINMMLRHISLSKICCFLKSYGCFKVQTWNKNKNMFSSPFANHISKLRFFFILDVSDIFVAYSAGVFVLSKNVFTYNQNYFQIHKFQFPLKLKVSTILIINSFSLSYILFKVYEPKVLFEKLIT